jgi:hypothetical protein
MMVFGKIAKGLATPGISRTVVNPPLAGGLGTSA